MTQSNFGSQFLSEGGGSGRSQTTPLSDKLLMSNLHNSTQYGSEEKSAI